ncbi:UNVERIFIED_CONTAM: protein SPIRAL1-like 5 [Sesamum radiatum]|uniref:Protein SPIRAL1-like 5 n=1 Tax=Sesamum radiatum TaxID=300843 RepID=A0AAW2KZZ3_SESRA
MRRRGGSYGGGQSSLGHLFGSDNKQQNKEVAPPSPTAYMPPYGIDTEENTIIKEPENPSPSQDKLPKVSNNYHRNQGQNSGNFITVRPSTKVTSAPGGESSLGYLFQDES